MSQTGHVVLGKRTESLICWFWSQHLRRAMRCVRGKVDDGQKPVLITRLLEKTKSTLSACLGSSESGLEGDIGLMRDALAAAIAFAVHLRFQFAFFGQDVRPLPKRAKACFDGLDG